MVYNPEIILSGRRLNDSMGYYVAENLINTMILKKIRVQDSKILIMGFSFKENCPDVRNTRVIDVVSHLKSHDCSVDVYDPIVNKKEIKDAYNIDLIKTISNGSYDAIIIAVAHEEFKKLEFNAIKNMCKKNHVIYDLKYVFTSKESNLRL